MRSAISGREAAPLSAAGRGPLLLFPDDLSAKLRHQEVGRAIHQSLDRSLQFRRLRRALAGHVRSSGASMRAMVILGDSVGIRTGITFRHRAPGPKAR